MLQQDSRASLAMNVEHDTMIAAESEPDSLCGRLIDNYSSRFWGCWVGCGGGLWRWAVAVGCGGGGGRDGMGGHVEDGANESLR